MNPYLCKLSVWTMILICLHGNVFAAQEGLRRERERSASDSRTTTRVTLGSSSGTAGSTVVVPIYFTPAEGVEVARLKLEVNLVSVNLKFEKLS